MAENCDDIPMPPHVYVPGFSPRHPASLFQTLKASVAADVASNRLHHTLAFKAGRHYFETGHYWECHEVLEAVWRQTRDPSPERDMVLALIQLANARLKILMLQPRAALRLCDMVDAHLARCPAQRAVLGLHVSEMQSAVSEARLIAKSAIQSP